MAYQNVDTSARVVKRRSTLYMPPIMASLCFRARDEKNFVCKYSLIDF